jgi:hypothetical protein
VTAGEDNVDGKLKRLAAETESIGASAQFSTRVMQGLPRVMPSGFWTDVTASARWLVPAFALAAVVAVVWAVSSEELNTELLASTETAEIEW